MTYRKLLAAASAAVMITMVTLGLVADVSADDDYQVVYNFGVAADDGRGPNAAVISDAAGNLYGTTAGGGTFQKGTVFKLTREPDGRWTETVLHSFEGNDGNSPESRLIFDRAGNLYGTTQNGGVYGDGTVFKLTREPDGGWTESVLHSFHGRDGNSPYSGLILDRAGNLYGTTEYGGTYGSGTVFKLTREPDDGWTESVLHSFQGADGTMPLGDIVFDKAGNLYGTTVSGGINNWGLVFKLAPATNGEWIETVLHEFKGTDGASPWAGLIFDRAGNLYGTTSGQGGLPGQSLGTVFKLSPEADGKWIETVLHNFEVLADGVNPMTGLIFDAAGNLYGTTFGGGPVFSLGTVFKLSPEANGRWIKTVVHTFIFEGLPGDGAEPMGALIIDRAGNLYGTTPAGGSSGNCFLAGCGVLFQIMP